MRRTYRRERMAFDYFLRYGRRRPKIHGGLGVQCPIHGVVWLAGF
jgi:hypothetical protein